MYVVAARVQIEVSDAECDCEKPGYSNRRELRISVSP